MVQERIMIPGPVPLHAEVAAELAKPALPHYGGHWVPMYRETQDLLRRLFQMDDADVFPLAGPGHAALGALAATLFAPGDKAVVVDNGFFGSRLADVLQAHRVAVTRVAASWGRAPPLEAVAAALEGGDVRALAAVHSETTTGMANPIDEFGKIARKHGALFLVDAVSSLGGMPLPCERWHVDACFGASQKCLAAPAGIAPLAVKTEILDGIDPKGVTGWYLNLFTWRKFDVEWGKWHPQPTTMSSNVFLAFRRAVQLVFEEGLEARYRRHEVLARAFWAGLDLLGFEGIPDPQYPSFTVTCVRPPGGVDANDLQRRLRTVHGIFVSGTLGKLRGEGIRVGHMGTTANYDDLRATLAACAAIVRPEGREAALDAFDALGADYA
jgi:alanine-glyoxylate transaminase/serine-glyoxylate transaminase/serine-pyruvate transaminase